MMALLPLLRARMPAIVTLFLAVLLVGQIMRIEGLPLLGGGYKARIATLERERDQHALADARDEARRLAAQQQQAARGEGVARAHLAARASVETQIRTVVKEVPVYVSAASDAKCVLPVGAVRLLDAAASGADPARLRDHIAPGQPDDAASGITLSEAVALLAANLGAARLNAGQLEHLQRALTAE